MTPLKEDLWSKLFVVESEACYETMLSTFSTKFYKSLVWIKAEMLC
jgi:hypothetical protein